MDDKTPTDSTKQCYKCKNVFPATTEFFHRARNTPTGLCGKCKPCAIQVTRDRYHQKHDEILSKNRNISDEERAKLNERRRENYKLNPELKRASDKRYREKSYPKIRTRQRKWEDLNPEKKSATGARYRAKKRSLPKDYTVKDWRFALDYFNGRCAICGEPIGLWHTIAADHWIPVSHGGGTTVDNIVPLCHSTKDAPFGTPSCNNRKHNTMPEDWLTREYGKRKAASIIAAINAFFERAKTNRDG